MRVRPAWILIAAALAQAASAVPRSGSDATATFFARQDFTGHSFSADRPVASFRASGLNDGASSIAIRNGRWIVCEGDDFHGACRVIDRSFGRLDRIGLGGRIESARPLDIGAENHIRPVDSFTPIPGGSWTQSCRDARVSGTILRAACNNGDRAWLPAQLDLRRCPTHRAGNAYGRLVCE